MGGDVYVKKSTLLYKGSAGLDDLLDVGIQCAQIGRSSMDFQCGIFRDDRLLVTAELVYVFADPATQKSKPVPDILRDMLQAQEAGVPYIDMARRLGAVSGSV